MRRRFGTSLTIAAFAVLLLANVAAAQEGSATFRSRDWRGQPIDYACKASRGDAESLRQALIRQELFRLGSDTKAETGWYYGDRLRTARLKTRQVTAAQLLARITQRLRADATTLRTSVLIYDVGISREQPMLCVWLVTPQGIVAAETVPIARSSRVPLGGFAENARNVLGVTRIALARSPKPRGHPAQTSSIPTETQVPVATGVSNLDAISALLLPASARRELVESRTERLLVLPAADFSTVPFAALSIDGRVLIDIASVVVLTGIDELVSPLARDIWSRRFSDATLARLIVGDPDSSSDELLWDPLPGARDEALSVTSLLARMPGETLLGPDAAVETVERVLRRPNHGMIYFATHGIADASDPLVRSFLLLSGGRLHVKEIAAQRHERQPLVVMSACQTGLGKAFEGGTFGLARGWLKAGAGQVVTSLWDIGDEWTKELMADFVARMVKDNRPPEVALRAAMLAARDQRNVPAAGWAGFAMLGFASE
ncbi:MAG: CHAT domain-containing protein [Hyphomicrobiaceae bacterium]